MPGRRKRIVEAGHDAQRRNRINEDAIKSGHVVIGIGSAEHYQEHQDDLGSSRELAVDAGRERPVAGDQQNYDRDNENQHIAAENKNREPPRQLPLKRQKNERGRQQEFVGNGVEIRAEGGALIQTAREQTVNPIGKAGDNKNQERPAVTIVSDEHEKDRQEAEAQKRDLVGDRPDAAFHCDSG